MAKGKIWGILKAPLHFVVSIPVAAVSLVVPPAGIAYVGWRKSAEKEDVAKGRDTEEKAHIDLFSQTILVSGVLKIWGKS